MLFSAYKSSSEGSISTKVTIRFDSTYINIGEHYHTEDGIFIAPVTGTYMFHWTIATGGSQFSTQLMVGGIVRASNLVPHPGGSDSSSAMVIINVQKEDHVWIQLYGSSEHVYGGSSSFGNSQSTFSGILLQKTWLIFFSSKNDKFWFWFNLSVVVGQHIRSVSWFVGDNWLIVTTTKLICWRGMCNGKYWIFFFREHFSIISFLFYYEHVWI